MGAEIEVASLFGRLGIRVDQGSWSKGTRAIDGMKASLTGLAAKALAVFGFGALIKSGLKLNSTVEESKTQIAGMLALTKKSNLSDEIGNADMLMGNLQKRAATLPGTTQEYVAMLGMLTQPVTAAGLGLKDLEDLTVNGVVAAKGLGVAWDVAARDIDQALRGQYKSVDQLTGKLLSSMGYAGEAGRAKFNALSAKQRASVVKAALTQKQIVQLAEAQGKTFSGRLSTLQDAAQQFLGKVGSALFSALGNTIEKVTKWIDENQAAINELADTIGTALADAFQILSDIVVFFVDNPKLVKILLAIGAAIALWRRPLLLASIAITALFQLFQMLRTHIGTTGAALVTLGAALAGAFAIARISAFIGKIQAAALAMLGLKAASKGVNGAVPTGGGGGVLSKAGGYAAAAAAAYEYGPDLGRAAGWLWDKVNGVKRENLDAIDHVVQPRSGSPMSVPAREPITRPGRSGGPVSMNIGAPIFNITSQTGDPVAIGNEVDKRMHDFWTARVGEMADVT